jgi:hypothetical protein
MTDMVTAAVLKNTTGAHPAPVTGDSLPPSDIRPSSVEACVPSASTTSFKKNLLLFFIHHVASFI